MKKLLILVLVAILTISAVGVVSANTGNTPPNPPGSNKEGVQHGNSAAAKAGLMGRGGILGRAGKNGGALHDELVKAFAASIEMDPALFQSKLENDHMTIYQVVREAKPDLSEADTLALINTSYKAALDSAMAAGLLTQGQADWLWEKHTLSWSNGNLPGFESTGEGETVSEGEETGEGEGVEEGTAPQIQSGNARGHHKPAKVWKNKHR